MTVETWSDGRFAQARAWRDQLGEHGIWFAPVRHHSPACARAVAAMITQLQPQGVLIEGPSEYDRLLPVLADPDTRPPVAILSLRPSAQGPVSSFFPLADFSPEWVGLRQGTEQGAAVNFIDHPWSDSIAGPDDPAVRGLAGERYYAESQALTALAQQEHCRDHDELWEHLFELRPGDNSDWPQFFDDVFAWSALARLDYEPEVLVAEGSVARESFMAAKILDRRQRTPGPLVVITGAFHTLALVETLAASLLADHDPDQPTGRRPSRRKSGRKTDNASTDSATHDSPTSPSPSTRSPGRTVTSDDAPAWLIRYDLTRLNALTGYGAGIRSPGFYQRQWEAGGDVAATCLADIARLANAAGTSDHLSVAEVIEATLQAHRLAGLRGHARPGRADLLDACLSCFGQGELAPAIRDAIAEIFGGSRLGTVPRDNPAPPIIAEARAAATRLRLVVDDSAPRKVSLDVRRSAPARTRSRFFWLMSFLDTGFAQRLAGPDYIAGVNLARLHEEWEYAWTPLVEARLIELVSQGATLHEAARAKLRATENDCDPRSSGAVAALVAQAALIGLDDEVERLRAKLDRMIEQDSSLDSVFDAVRQILSLCRARDLIGLNQPEELLALVNRALPQLAYLLEKSGGVSADDEPGVIKAIIGAHDLIRTVDDPAILLTALSRLRAAASAPGVMGAALALGVTAGEVTDDELGAKVRAMFAPGADPGQALRFFDGIMQAAPDLFLHTPELFEAVNQAITSLEPETFLSFLPDLRQTFTHLRPSETAQVAQAIASRWGLDASAIDAAQGFGAADLQLGIAVEQALLVSLAADQLLGIVSGQPVPGGDR